MTKNQLVIVIEETRALAVAFAKAGLDEDAADAQDALADFESLLARCE